MQGWHRMFAALGEAVPRLRLRHGATEAQLADAEARLGFPLPADYRAWLRLADGQEPGGLALFPLLVWFSPLDVVVATSPVARADQPCPVHSLGVGHLRDVLCCLPASEQLWITRSITPEPSCALRVTAGESHQVLAAFDERHVVVLGESLSSYFDRLAGLIESRQVVPGSFGVEEGYEMLGAADGGSALNLIRMEPLPLRWR